MWTLLKRNSMFLVPYLLVWCFAAIILTLFSKAQIHIFLNSFHAPMADTFFSYLTFLGDGYFSVVVIVACLLWSFRKSLVIALSNLVALGIVSLFKYVIYFDTVRPKVYFETVEKHQLYYVDGVDLNSFNSFPSGHTMGAFCLLFGVSLFTENKWVKLGLFLLAALVGYSRIYLSQHFLVDVVAGSLIGVVITLLFYMVVGKMKYSWLDKSLLYLKKN